MKCSAWVFLVLVGGAFASAAGATTAPRQSAPSAMLGAAAAASVAPATGAHSAKFAPPHITILWDLSHFPAATRREIPEAPPTSRDNRIAFLVGVCDRLGRALAPQGGIWGTGIFATHSCAAGERLLGHDATRSRPAPSPWILTIQVTEAEIRLAIAWRKRSTHLQTATDVALSLAKDTTLAQVAIKNGGIAVSLLSDDTLTNLLALALLEQMPVWGFAPAHDLVVHGLIESHSVPGAAAVSAPATIVLLDARLHEYGPPFAITPLGVATRDDTDMVVGPRLNQWRVVEVRAQQKLAASIRAAPAIVAAQPASSSEGTIAFTSAEGRGPQPPRVRAAADRQAASIRAQTTSARRQSSASKRPNPAAIYWHLSGMR